MIRLLGSRGASAVTGFIMLALASSGATAAPTAAAAAVSSTPTVVKSSAYETAVATPTAAVANAATADATATQTAPAKSVTVTLPAPRPVGSTISLAPEIAKEAAWLYRNGWPLYALVDRYSAGAPLNEEANCVAVAVYFEARGETLEGQLAVARVVMNRAASGKYPASWCATVKQPWQFSFVNPRTGQYPRIDEASASWRKAQAIARLALSNAIPSLSSDVLWYHADYVAPGWGKRLNRVEKIGTHIFYRA